MRRQGQYDHSLHATKCSAPHSPRQGANTAPRYRDYQPSKWMGQPMVLNSTGTMGSHTQFLGDNRTVRSLPLSCFVLHGFFWWRFCPRCCCSFPSSSRT